MRSDLSWIFGDVLKVNLGEIEKKMQDFLIDDNGNPIYNDDSNVTETESTESFDTSESTESIETESTESFDTSENTESFDTSENTESMETESTESFDSDGTTDVSELDANDFVADDTTESVDESNTEINDGDNVLDVDNEFGGDLNSAVSAANEGDTVKLGNKTYYASEINIDKNIALEGQEGSVIDGGGTNNSIIKISSGASGAIIRGMEITNGNNGIEGYGASNVTLQNLDVNNIGINQPMRDGQNNTGISLSNVDGVKILDSTVEDIGRKAVSVGATDGATISGLTIKDVNLAAQHSQAHDAAGVKLYNTNDVAVKNNYFSDINAINIWNDSTNATAIESNVATGVGEDFIKPSFNDYVEIVGIYNEKSSNATVANNDVSALDGFTAFRATEFSTETMNLGSNNFSSSEIGTTDYWVNEEVEKLIATTPDPSAANFSMFSSEYYGQAII